MVECYSLVGLDSTSRGVSAIPQSPQLPGSGRAISGCIGQVHPAPRGAPMSIVLTRRRRTARFRAANEHDREHRGEHQDGLEAIFAKLALPATADDHRRVLAVLTFLNSG